MEHPIALGVRVHYLSRMVGRFIDANAFLPSGSGDSNAPNAIPLVDSFEHLV